MLFGFDVRAESLPDDVAASARALLARGDMRAALSLLYRGALIYLINDGKLDIARGDTEDVCVRNVARLYEKPRAAYFASLVRAWQQVAYAGSVNHSAVLTSAAIQTLIDHWSAHFQLRQSSSAADAVVGVPA
jgi:hypothetical protein